jgi:hypothetical protein
MGDLWVSRFRTEGGYIATWQCDDDAGNNVCITIGRADSQSECEAVAEKWYRSRLLEALEPATEQDTRGTE